MINVLSLGAGIQSSAVLLMSCRGMLPKLDAAIFADTKWEPPHVYAQLRYVTARATTAGIPVHVVTVGNLRDEALEFFSDRKDHERWASMPVFIKNPDGTVGRMNRQCTKEYKIEAIESAVRRDVLGLKPRQHAKRGAVSQWIGISTDEKGRMRMSKKRWITNQYPLLNYPVRMAAKEYSRDECAQWLADSYPDRVWTESSCKGCPNHDNETWLTMKLSDPASFMDACDFDDEMRKAEVVRRSTLAIMVGLPYLHRSCVPLREIDFNSLIAEKKSRQKLVKLEKSGQRNWIEESEHCDSGYCGI